MIIQSIYLTKYLKINGNAVVNSNIVARDYENDIILSQLMSQNDEYTYYLNLNYSLTAGNAGNIIVLIDNDIRGKIGDYGEVVDSIVIDSDFNN